MAKPQAAGRQKRPVGKAARVGTEIQGEKAKAEGLLAGKPR